MCVRACDYGDCDDFNQCICSEGYESHNGVCKMTCDKECINGKCLNDQCTCDDGFVEFNSTNCVSKEFIIQRDHCIAICSNGICLDSNECLCYQGFKFNKEQEKCLPSCSFENSNECINGKCVAPNECECLAGYKLGPKSDYQCDPVCENCDNGYCEKPGVCVCNKGFFLEASGCSEEDHDLEELIDNHSKTTTEPAFSSESTLIILDGKLSTINEIDYEIESTTISSFVPMSTTKNIDNLSTDELQYSSFFDNATEYTSDVSESTTDNNFETEKSTALSIDTSTESFFFISTDLFEYNSDYYESITSNIVTDKVVTNQEKVGKVTISYDASFEPTSTATNYYTTSDPEIDNSSYLGITESETTDIDYSVKAEIENTTGTEMTTGENDNSSLNKGAMVKTQLDMTSESEMTTGQNDSLNTTPLDKEIDVDYLETTEIENNIESNYTENIILGSSSTNEVLTTLNDGSEMTINDKNTNPTSDHTTSSFYNEESSTLEDIIHEITASNLEYSESSTNIEATSSESSFIDNNINAESPSPQQESSSNRYNIDDSSSTSPSKMMKYSSDDVNPTNDASKLNITNETKLKSPLNSCEKFCDDGSCTINGTCDKKPNTLICNCIHGTCIENICICNQGYIISSKDNSMCIREVQV